MGAIAEVYGRRFPKRFPAKESALLYIKSDVYGMLLYHLIESSNGGLSFFYLGEDILINGSSDLSIVVGNNYHMTEIPVETVSDTPMVNGYKSLRRRGVRFGKLSPM